MRKRNSNAEFSSQRSRFLLKNFRESIARQSQISLRHELRETADAPAPRFWVTEARAVRVVAAMMAGQDVTDSMLPQKREMYAEIFKRVTKLKDQKPWMPLGDLVFEVVNGSAPHSYITPDRVYTIIRKAKKSL